MLQRIDYPELFFGLVAPIGVDLSDTLNQLADALRVFGYQTIPIKVTDLFREIDFCDLALTDKPIEDRFRSYIDFGNRVRELTDDQSICAALVIDKIAKLRQRDSEGKPVSEEKAGVHHSSIQTKRRNRFASQRLWSAIFPTFCLFVSRRAFGCFFTAHCSRSQKH